MNDNKQGHNRIFIISIRGIEIHANESVASLMPSPDSGLHKLMKATRGRQPIQAE